MTPDVFRRALDDLTARRPHPPILVHFRDGRQLLLRDRSFIYRDATGIHIGDRHAIRIFDAEDVDRIEEVEPDPEEPSHDA